LFAAPQSPRWPLGRRSALSYGGSVVWWSVRPVRGSWGGRGRTWWRGARTTCSRSGRRARSTRASRRRRAASRSRRRASTWAALGSEAPLVGRRRERLLGKATRETTGNGDATDYWGRRRERLLGKATRETTGEGDATDYWWERRRSILSHRVWRPNSPDRLLALRPRVLWIAGGGGEEARLGRIWARPVRRRARTCTRSAIYTHTPAIETARMKTMLDARRGPLLRALSTRRFRRLCSVDAFALQASGCVRSARVCSAGV
jgi:hypothetical protein